MKQKANAYDKVREKIALRFGSNVAEEIFSEFELSDDEKIRKEIMYHIQHCDDTIDKETEERMIAWLEKQGEQKSVEDSLTLEEFENAFITKAKQYDIDLPNRSWDIYALCKELYSLKHKPMQGEQKNVDKSKFNVGDWVVTSYGKVNQIITVDEDGDGYTLDDGTYFSGSWCDMYHLWTIQDAKDGDVLVNGSNIFIFHFINDTRLMGYCHINTDDGRFYDDIGKNECFCLIDAVVNPATKEQRDQLEKAMADAGYTFDFEKKELRKIEQKFAEWDEDDENRFNNLIFLVERSDENEPTKKGFIDFINRLKSISHRKHWKLSDEHYELEEQKSAEWSEEDETALGDALWCCKQAASIAKDENDMGNIWYAERWLKSLKNRVQPQTWEPTEEQAKWFFRGILGYYNFSSEGRKIMEEICKQLEQLKQL